MTATKGRQVLNLWTGKAAAHPFSIEAKIAETSNAGGEEYFNCWRCRRTEKKPVVGDHVKGRRNRARAQADIDASWKENIERHQAADCLRITKPKTRPHRHRGGDVPRCGAQHPDYASVTCTAHTVDRQGKPRKHRGKHRAKIVTGHVVRWDRAPEAGAR